MATIANSSEDRSFSIGTVLSRAFGVMGDNPITIFGISFLFGALPQQFYSYYMRSVIANAGPGSANALAIGTLSAGSFVVMIVLAMVVQAALVRATIDYSEGGRTGIGASLAVGLSMALPLIGMTLLMIPALMIAAVLFFIPAVILFLMWSVATPALIAERIGVFAAFGRSRYLTKGARWKILGLLVLVWVVLIIISGVVGAVTLAMGAASALNATAPIPIPILILGVITATLTTAFMSTAITSLYISLRNWKDGPQAHSLADIFA